MTVQLTIPPGLTVDELVVADLVDLLEGSAVEVSEEIMRGLLAARERYLDHSGTEFVTVIARGLPAVEGTDGWLEWQEGFDPDEAHPMVTHDPLNEGGSEDDGGPIDHYSRKGYTVVDVDDHIATVHPPTPAERGHDVTGAELIARDGEAFRIETDHTCRIEPDGRIVATTGGVLSWDRGRLTILECLEIHTDVDFHTGHIEFDGPVIVHGGVKDCFQIRCTEDLDVHGLVEAADIACGGVAHFRSGMVGKERGSLQIEGRLTARYLEHVRGFIGGRLEVERGIFNCHLRIGDSLVIERGAVVGGSLRLHRKAIIATLGSAAEAPTVVGVGGDPELGALADELRSTMREVRDRQDRETNELRSLLGREGFLRSSERTRSVELKHSVQRLEEWMQQLRDRLIRVQEGLRRHHIIDVEVTTSIHAGASIRYEGRQYRFATHLRGPLQIISNDRGRLMLVDLVGQSSRPLDEVAPLQGLGSESEEPGAHAA